MLALPEDVAQLTLQALEGRRAELRSKLTETEAAIGELRRLQPVPDPVKEAPPA